MEAPMLAPQAEQQTLAMIGSGVASSRSASACDSCSGMEGILNGPSVHPASSRHPGDGCTIVAQTITSPAEGWH
jgi:hypothetical protein